MNFPYHWATVDYEDDFRNVQHKIPTIILEENEPEQNIKTNASSDELESGGIDPDAGFNDADDDDGDGGESCIGNSDGPATVNTSGCTSGAMEGKNHFSRGVHHAGKTQQAYFRGHAELNYGGTSRCSLSNFGTDFTVRSTV